MSDDKLYTVTVFTTWTTGEVLHDLFPILDLSPTSYFDKDDQVATLSVYYETAEEAIAVEARLQKEIESWKAFSEIGQYEINSIEIKKEDWSETWKAFFHPEKVSDRLVVKPSWEDYDAAEGEIILEIDPGMSFGTGAHGTTRGCLQMIDRISLNTPGASFIDMGSGSGILSIAAAKLGFTAIEAFDYDADAVRIAGDNFALTGVADQINVYTQDLSEYEASKTFDIVTANILPHVLLPNSDRIINAIKKESSSRLILSGILNEQYENLRDHFVAAGLEENANLDIDKSGFSGAVKVLARVSGTAKVTYPGCSIVCKRDCFDNVAVSVRGNVDAKKKGQKINVSGQFFAKVDTHSTDFNLDLDI